MRVSVETINFEQTGIDKFDKLKSYFNNGFLTMKEFINTSSEIGMLNFAINHLVNIDYKHS